MLIWTIPTENKKTFKASYFDSFSFGLIYKYRISIKEDRSDIIVKTRCFYSFTTAKKTVILPEFLVWKFCGKAQFPHSFGRFVRNYAETVPFHKISTPGNSVKLRYFMQCILKRKFPIQTVDISSLIAI